ncbi:piggybac transposable element-derived protein [Anaeramoeba flamelloides]|uniref:Piggybac transposable element-derived protein n=1 Tax=Anaeramoeba flamelloides TaxID=1746091 RepID=A0ABQ8XIY8_9EUKA|nr:piggybac transposable element-derived protein [Anaeramoeba flamelloides]
MSSRNNNNKKKKNRETLKIKNFLKKEKWVLLDNRFPENKSEKINSEEIEQIQNIPEFKGCPTESLIGKTNILDIFESFFDQELISILLNVLNEERVRRLNDISLKSKSLPIDKKFLKKDLFNYLSCFIAMGIHPNTDISDHWKKNSILETKWIKDIMSRGRFQAIHRCWRFNNETNFDLVRKIIKKKCMENWELSNQVVIDETLIKSKCRCRMIVRMPRKPQKQGLKIWVLADSDNYYYCWDLYMGKPETTHETLMKLTKYLPLEKYPKFYFKVIADAYFGSTNSVRELLDIGVNFTLMCRKDRTSKIFKKQFRKISR